MTSWTWLSSGSLTLTSALLSSHGPIREAHSSPRIIVGPSLIVNIPLLPLLCLLSRDHPASNNNQLRQWGEETPPRINQS